MRENMYDYTYDTHSIANDRSMPNTFGMRHADNKTGTDDQNSTEYIPSFNVIESE